MFKARVVCFVLLASLVAAPMVLAQGAATGAIQGTVTDKSGAVVPGATITIKNLATSFEIVVVSESTGLYRFPGLVPGNYSLKTELAGFATYEVKTVVVNVGRTTDVNVTLQPAGTQTTITVSEVAPLVETTKTDVGGVIENREVLNLPLNGRNFSSLATLIPGARPVGSWDPTKTRIGAVSIAGAGGRNINTTIDGIDNKDSSVGGYVQNIALEGVKEFALKTQRFSAADGRSQGGLLSIVTKSGSNEFHGTWFTFARDKVLNANDYFTQKNEIAAGKTAGSLKPDFRRWMYGGSIGGPIKRDKAFFFFTYERFQEDMFTIMATTAVAELQALKDAKISIYGASPGPVDKLAMPFSSKMWTARADFVVNDSNNVYLSWNNSYNRSDNDQGPTDLTSTNFNTNRNYIMSMVWNSLISPKVLNQFVWGSSYWNNLIDTDNYSPVTVSFASVSYGTNGNVPQQTFQKKWQIKDSLNWNKGSHGFRFGGDWVIEPWLGGFFGYTPVPAVSFFDNPTTILTNKTKYPQGFSTPGIVSGIAATNGITYSRYTYPNYIHTASWYVQDDWRVSRKLTLNLGVRWDADIGLVGPDILKNCRTYLIVQKINDPLTNGFKSIPKDDMNNFAPRFGFAFDPTGQGKTVIRGGYGMYYDQLFNNINLFAMQQSFPVIFGTVVSLVNASIGKGDLPTWVVNVDPLPTPDPSKPLTNLPANASGRLMDPDYVSPMSQQFNLGWSQEFAKDFVLEADYTHLLNTHESRRIRLNYKIVLPDGSNPRRLASAFTAAGMPTNTLADIINDASTNRSRYDGLNIGIRKRLSHRLTFQTSYTLSRALGYAGSSGEFGATARYNQANYMDPRELSYTGRDERHRFVFSGVLDLPWGFQIGPVVQVGSARPYTLTAGTDLNKDGLNTDICVAGTVAPNGRACPQGAGINLQRGGYDLDGNWQSGKFFIMDLRVTKFINLSKVREGMNIGFFFESFNLTNRTNFGNRFSGTNTGTQFMTTQGLPTGTYGITTAAPYQAQLGFRFTF
jgi:hypothetical protein